MEDIGILVLIGVCFFYLGWRARERAAVHMVNKILNNVETQISDQQDSVVHIVIEKHDGVFYVYGMNDNTFMAQGSTRKELETNLITRYPDKSFAATTDNLKEVGFV